MVFFLFNFPFLHLAPNFPEGREMGTTRTNLGTSLIITYPEKPFGKTSLVRIFPQNWHSSTFFSFVFSSRPAKAQLGGAGRGGKGGRTGEGGSRSRFLSDGRRQVRWWLEDDDAATTTLSRSIWCVRSFTAY